MNNDKMAFSIESLLSARLLLSPQLSEGKIYFISDMGGVGMSLYSMDADGGFPQPLLPKGIALQNPYLMGTSPLYKVFPNLERILVMIDQDGNENYQPCLIPLEGGGPLPLLPDRAGQQLAISYADIKRNLAYFSIDDRRTPDIETIRVNIENSEYISMGKSIYGNDFQCANKDLSKAIMLDVFASADHVLYLWDAKTGQREHLLGMPLEERKSGATFEAEAYFDCHFAPNEENILCRTSRFSDTYNAAFFPLDDPTNLKQIEITGIQHSSEAGMFTQLQHVYDDIYRLSYNIDGCSYAYEAELKETGSSYLFQIHRAICGKGSLSQGVLQHISEEIREGKPEYALSFATATTPPQIYRFGKQYPDGEYYQVTNEKVLGIPQKYLSSGEDASYTSFDGLRISARLYMPSPELYDFPRPLVVWVHGGPQSQERPDFAWFSMPLIQALTLNGFAVFVPNVRGSRGYGVEYMRKVERDWGGDDRLDHLEGLKMLENDHRIDSKKRAVGGRSYGGFMTLTLITRHPELWQAGIDMFGPYDLLGFFYRLPKTWQTFFKITLGDPDKEDEREFLIERSPKTYLNRLQCPLLVIQGKNDPRVLEEESKEIAKNLKREGKIVEYLMFPDEGHDVLKFKNKIQCFSKIVEFLKRHLS